MTYYILLSAICFFASGICQGIFECTTIINSMQKHWTRTILIKEGFFYYWSRELFVENKDRNFDGKATWFEKTFPNDGGHRIKVLQIFLVGVGATMLGLAFKYSTLTGDQIICSSISLPFIIWWIISLGFSISFDICRKK